MIGTAGEKNTGGVMSDPNLTHLDAELRRLWLCLDKLTPPEVSVQAEPHSQAVELEIKKIESFLNSFQAQAQEQRWELKLQEITAAFQLNDFERRLLLLAAAPELDEAFGLKIAQAQASETVLPSVGLAWRLFCPSLAERITSRDSLREDAPLFRLRLLELEGPDAPLPGRLLRADRRIVDALVGRILPDARITSHLSFFRPSTGEATPDPAGSNLAGRLAGRIREFLQGEAPVCPPLIVNCFGAPLPDLEAFAIQACHEAGLSLLLATAGNLSASQIPLLIRESALLPCALFVGGFGSQAVGDSEWAGWLSCVGLLAFIGSEQALHVPRELESRTWLSVAVPRLDVPRRIEEWQRALGESRVEGNASLSELADNFEFGTAEIRRTARQAANAAWLLGEPLGVAHVKSACRREVQHHMSELAQQLKSQSGWNDLLLPEEALIQLRELCAQVRCQRGVLEGCGFGARLSRGRGVTALFAGPSGTGKTMAAEVVARELERELYRIDLARVVSKYIGETEKNLRLAVKEAERARCVLLFDEADALFGRRTEVRDSHDRYANLEVSYLLQLMEETEAAVVLLATNRREAIDQAFLRRFRFLIDFPLPDAQVRRKIWATSFPPQVQIRDLQFDELADLLPLSAASIKNIALAATCLAASNGGVVSSKHIAHATRRELERMGRPTPFSEADLAIRPVAKGGPSARIVS